LLEDTGDIALAVEDTDNPERVLVGPKIIEPNIVEARNGP
jgi:hypothetical protein